VLATDAVASIKRWARRDPLMQVLQASIAEVTVVDDRRFRFRLHRPVPLLTEALGQTQFPCFVMPERIAQTDAFQQVRDAIGSGPFRFVQNEWNPGQRAVWARNERYQPRQEPVDGLAGGRAPRIDRIEWTIITDPATSANAMTLGEQDYWEYPLHDLLPVMRRSRELVVQQRLLDGTYGICRFNTLQPPFNNRPSAVPSPWPSTSATTSAPCRQRAGWLGRLRGRLHLRHAAGNEAGSEILKDPQPGARARRAGARPAYNNRSAWC
jgi:peptide/nickel transport system substrate-binding protein